DEPTNHLDFKNQIDLLENLKEWIKTKNKIVVGVLHDLNLVQYFADNVLMLQNGQVVSYGPPQKVLNDPILDDLYGIDIKGFMLNILKKWEGCVAN
ncbi:MAG: ABC transporter ATP-binding protein, partial [Intestinibacter sp.]